MTKHSLIAAIASLGLVACTTAPAEQEEAAEASPVETTAEALAAAAQDGDTEPAAAAQDEEASPISFNDCKTQQFITGWVEITCENGRFLLQPDRAQMATIEQTWGPMADALAEQYGAPAEATEVKLTVADQAVPARAFTVTDPDTGAALATGIYALWPMGETSKMAGACLVEGEASLDEEACRGGFESIAVLGLPSSDL